MNEPIINQVSDTAFMAAAYRAIKKGDGGIKK
jgi:hypothetical protein